MAKGDEVLRLSAFNFHVFPHDGGRAPDELAARQGQAEQEVGVLAVAVPEGDAERLRPGQAGGDAEGGVAAAQPLAQPFLWDPDRAIGLAGDWCGGARIEAAFLSGKALAQAIAG